MSVLACVCVWGWVSESISVFAVCVCVWRWGWEGGDVCVWKTQLFVSMFMHLWAWIHTCLSDSRPQSTFMSECIICLLCDRAHKWTKMSHGEIQTVIWVRSPLSANRGQHFLSLSCARKECLPVPASQTATKAESLSPCELQRKNVLLI